jgi:uncharacterized membrane protein YfcA
MSTDESLLAVLIFIAALLYSSVGHGGASGYLAAMALFNVAPTVMKPTALSLNILVSSIAFVKFYRAGAFSWRLFWPFAITSIPMAYLGGTISLPGHLYKPLVGVILIYAAAKAFWTAKQATHQVNVKPQTPILLIIGAALGFLSGLSGVGGGIFLSPLLFLFRWAEIKVISGIAAAFILVNSTSGLLGLIKTDPTLPSALPYWAVMAIAGGFIGAEFGSKRLSNPAIKRLLAVVLALAGIKMILIS